MPVAQTEDCAIMRLFDEQHNPESQGSFDLLLAAGAHAAQGYVNVAVDFNNDGVIGPYATADGEEQEEWVVRNVPLRLRTQGSLDRSMSLLFSFPDTSMHVNAMASCAVLITDRPLPGDASGKLEDMVSWDRFVTIVTGSTSKGARAARAVAYQRRGPSAPGPVMPAARGEGSDLMNGSVPDIHQKNNECGPTAGANSLIWLARREGFMQLLPHHDDGSADTTRLILDLMEAMSGTSRRPFKGLKGNQMFTGFSSYIEAHALPIEIEGGSGDPDARGSSTFDFIAQHQEDADGIQLLAWRPGGEGHWVTVTGHAQREGRAFLYVHDPDDRKQATVVWELTVDSDGTVTDRFQFPEGYTAAWAIAQVGHPDPNAAPSASR